MVALQINKQVIFRDLHLLHILIIELSLDMGFIMVGIADGKFVNGNHLQSSQGYIIEV